MSGPATAMVLAAGLGTRMRPLTDDRPKALVTVGGKTLIDHMLDRLASAGVQRAVVNVHAFADMLEAHLNKRRGGPSILISDERALALETGGGVKAARALLGEQPIWVANIDSVWLENAGPALTDLANAWSPDSMDACLLLTPTATALGFDGPGDFFCDAGGRLSPRRAQPGASTAPFAYMGVHITDPAPIYHHPEDRFGLFPIWVQMAEHGRLAGAILQGDWMHVGDPQARLDAEERLGRAQTR